MFVFIACLNAMNWRQGARPTDRQMTKIALGAAVQWDWDWEGNPICQSINFGPLIADIYVEENCELWDFFGIMLHILANLAFHPRGPLDLDCTWFCDWPKLKVFALTYNDHWWMGVYLRGQCQECTSIICSVGVRHK